LIGVATKNLESSPSQPSPEVDLVRAILQRALDDVLGYGGIQAQTDACRWIRSQEISLGSFQWTCQILNFDAQAVRSAILRRQLPVKRAHRRHSFRVEGHHLAL
jgi:hypothetical protein